MGFCKIYTINFKVKSKRLAKEQMQNKILSADGTNKIIFERLNSNESFFIGRLGSVELECISYYLSLIPETQTTKNNHYPNNVKTMIQLNAVFFLLKIFT